MDDIKPFAQDIVMLLLQCYQTQPHSSTLELSRQFFIMYGKNDDSMRPLMRSFLRQICERTLKEMQSTGNPSDFADLIASFFQVQCITNFAMDKKLIAAFYAFAGAVTNSKEISRSPHRARTG